MRQSICVLNPSLFEGCGYTAEEARSVGKQVLLSDIPPHREQNPPKATFFDPNDCDNLAEKLDPIWRETKPGPDTDLESEARHDLPKRLRAYGEAFISVAQEALEEIRS
jgi:glycosyltransferase involved in cell wall biosynthesis